MSGANDININKLFVVNSCIFTQKTVKELLLCHTEAILQIPVKTETDRRLT